MGLESGADAIVLRRQLRGVLGGGWPAKDSLGSFFVVVAPPAFDAGAGMNQCREPVLVEASSRSRPLKDST